MNDLMRLYGLPPISGGAQDDDENPPADPPTPPAAKVEFSPEQQEKLNAIVKEERDKAAREAREAFDAEQAELEAKRQKDAEAAARKMLKEQGNLSDLNTVLTTENEKLQAENERLTKELAGFHKEVETEYDAFVADMPVGLANFDPGAGATPAQKRDFMTKARKMIDEIGAPYRPGMPPTPPPRRPIEADPEGEVDEDMVEVVRRSPKYNRF